MRRPIASPITPLPARPIANRRARIVVERQPQPDRSERGRSCQRAEDPGKETGSRPDREQVAMDHHADECADCSKGDGVEPLVAVPHLVEQQVGADPQSAAGRHRHDHGEEGGPDLRLEEGPDDEADHNHRRGGDHQVLPGGPVPPECAVAGAPGRFLRCAVGSFECLQRSGPLPMCRSMATEPPWSSIVEQTGHRHRSADAP